MDHGRYRFGTHYGRMIRRGAQAGPFPGFSPGGLVLLTQVHASRGAIVNRETWPGTAESRRLPEDFVHTEAPLSPRFQKYWLAEPPEDQTEEN